MAKSAVRLGNSARKAVLLSLEAVDRGVPLQAALSESLEAVKLSLAARRQASDLAYWTVRGLVRCRFVLERIFPRFDGFPKPVARLLLAAAAALLFEDNAPVYAIVNETVSDVRLLAGKGAASAANAGLRALQRLGDAPGREEFYRLAGDKDDFSSFLRFVSVPEPLGRLVASEVGEEAARAILRKSFARPRGTVRLNPLRPDFALLREKLLAEGAVPLPGRAGSRGLEPVSSGGVRELAASGLLSLQSAGSQLALAAFDIPRDRPWWDMCAGFGGKTCALLEDGLDVALASDVSSRRLSHLGGECARLGLPAPQTLLCDGTRPPLGRWEGHILLDVPCTGLGVLARRPDIKLRKPDPLGSARLQKALLARALALVDRGACVLYVTCTVTKTENEEVVRTVARELGAELQGEWRTPLQAPFEDMFAALLRR